MRQVDDITLQKAKEGDKKAFEELVYAFEKLVYNIAYRMLYDKEDVYDISQEVFLRAYRNIEICEDIYHFKNWICKITNNICIDELRRRKGKVIESLDAELELEEGSLKKQIISEETGPEESFENLEEHKKIQGIINKLPMNYRTLIILRDAQGMSYEELSAITSQKVGTIKSRLSRARAKFKELYFAEQNKNKNVD